MNAPLPWQTEQWQRLNSASRSDRLGHALLFVGRSGLGKLIFARAFAKAALCEDRARDRACGNCRACVLLAAGNHPDFREVAPEEEGKAITVDQIRDLNSYFSLTSHYQRGKLALISPADSMNRAAANALLKRLEEPPAGALLMLVADRADSLPATVQSRCHRLNFDSFDPAAARGWLVEQLPDAISEDIDALLAQASGAPLRALYLATHDEMGLGRRVLEDMAAIGRGDLHAIDVARDFEGADIDLLIDTAMHVVYQLVLLKHGRQASYANQASRADDLHKLGYQLNFKHLFEFLDLLLEVRSLRIKKVPVREMDLMEGVWLGWSRAAQPHSVEA
jgi:DNA polymerase-3 subunit delta'